MRSLICWAVERRTEAPPPPPHPTATAAPPPAPPPSRQPAAPAVADEYARLKGMATDEIDRMGLLAEIHFDLDKSDIREGDRAILSQNAEVLKKFDLLTVTIATHCAEPRT